MCCHLCRVEVPPGEAHDNTPMHQAAKLIAVTALDRLRSQSFPDTEGTEVFVFGVPPSNQIQVNPGPTQPPTLATTTTFSTGSPIKRSVFQPGFGFVAPKESNVNCVTTNTNENSVDKNPKDPDFGTTFDGGLRIPATHVKFTPVAYINDEGKSVKGQCITFMKEYEDKCLEELRLEDYSDRIIVEDAFGVLRQHHLGFLRGYREFEWCDYCQQLVAFHAHVAHQRTKAHIEAAYQDQVFKEMVRDYVDEGGGFEIFRRPCERRRSGRTFYAWKQTVYNCGICEAHFVPVEFKKQHSDSIRHRACLALGAAACRRLRRHLAGGPAAAARAPRPVWTRALLAAYRYPHIRPELHHLPKAPFPPKKFFDRICSRLERIGTSEPEGYTIIVTEDEVITGTPKMAVDFRRFLGVGATVQGHAKCSVCGGVFKTGDGHWETEHVN